VRHLPEIEPGTCIGPYLVGAELGRGGIAVVYQAKHRTAPELGRLAIKVAFQTNQQRDKRFMREFERLRVIAIPGVARVYEAGAEDDLLWYVMDEVPGLSMDRQIAAGRTVSERVERAIEIGARLMDVLSGIHRLGFIHRDIKPSNLLVDRNRNVHVLDFGLVRLKERGDTLTRTGRLVGTVAFMSPEQTTGLTLSSGTDIFSAALVIYEGLVGPRKRPHKQEEWLGRMCLQRVVPLSIREPGVPRALSSLLDRMLSLDPHDRPSAEECAAAFRDLANGQGIPDWPDPPEFVGRSSELNTLVHAFDPGSTPLHVLQGPAGSGRRRLLEQVQRRALLYGTPRISGQCSPETQGGAILNVLRQLLATHADTEWRQKITGPDAGDLLSMWPTLPLIAPPPSRAAPTLEGIARAAAATIHRAVENAGLMIVIEDLDQVDGLTARVIQALIRQPPERMAVFATYDDRWASDRARRLIAALTDKELADTLTLTDLSGPQASKLASSLVGDDIGITVGGSSPQRARERGLERLSDRLGASIPPIPAAALPLALSQRPLPGAVLAVMGIDPDPLVDAGILLQDAKGLYMMAGEAIRRSAQSLLPDRRQAEDILADALTRGGMGAERWRDVASHMLRGKNPHRALSPAIQAAVHAAQTGQYDEARCWLMAIDPLPRDRHDPVYQSLRFELSWCRAQTSLATDLSRLRDDLVEQARARARTDTDIGRVALLDVQLKIRQGRIEDALKQCEQNRARKWDCPEPMAARFSLQAARMYLDQGRPEQALAQLQDAGPLKRDPHYALIEAELNNMMGEPRRCVEICRSAIASSQATKPATEQANLSLRLGEALRARGDRVGATQAVHGALDVLRTHGHRAHIAHAHVQAATLALGRGQPTTARVWLEPALAVARSFGLSRVEAEIWQLKLGCATSLGDNPAARAAIDGWRKSYRGDPSGFKHAVGRWHWADKDVDKALAAFDVPFVATQAGTHLAIDHAHVLLLKADRAAASRILSPALDEASAKGLTDLELMAHLVAGAIAPGPDTEWQETVRRARASPWMELSLMCLALDGHRWLNLGEPESARRSFTDLHSRAHNLGDELKISVANLGLRLC